MAVDIQVSGDNSGAIVVGDHNTVIINNAAGAVVLRESPVRVSRRAGPPGLQPRPFANLIDRSQESEELRGSLSATPPVHCNVYGAPGSGKTVLLRHVCTEAAIAAAFHDGVIYLPAASNTVNDLLQQFFDALFETDRPFKPSQVQLRTHLASVFALSVLDDFTGTPKDFERLSNLAATTTFALTSEAPVVGSEGHAIHLGGLPTGDAVALLSRELQRPIEAGEVMFARALCASFDGNPADIILLAAQSRTHSISLSELAAELRSAESPGRWLHERVIGALSAGDRKALAAFAAVDGEPLAAAEVAGMSGAVDASETLERLSENGLLSFDGKRYRLRRGVSAAIATSLLALIPARAAAQYFVAAAATTPAAALIERSGAILASMRHAAQASDSQSVMALARSVGDAVALSGRWDRWNEMLECALASARGVNDAAGEAWALHQIGSRALVLGDVATAQQALEAALHIRSQLADPDAVRVTEHNLRLLRPPTDPKAPHSKPIRRARNFKTVLVAAILVLLAAGSIAAIAARIYRGTIVRPIAAVTTSPTTSPTGSLPTPRGSPVPTHSLRAVATVAVAETSPSASVSVVESARPTLAPSVSPTKITATAPPPIAAPSILAFFYRDIASCLYYSVENASDVKMSGVSGSLKAPQGCIAVARSHEEQQRVLYAYGVSGPPARRVAVIPAETPSPMPATPIPVRTTTVPVKVRTPIPARPIPVRTTTVPVKVRTPIPARPIPVRTATIPARLPITRPLPLASAIRLGGITGTVVGARAAIAGADIEVSSGTFSFRTATDKLGRFTIVNLPPGPCRLTVSKSGYGPVTQMLRIGGATTDVGTIRLVANATIIQ